MSFKKEVTDLLAPLDSRPLLADVLLNNYSLQDTADFADQVLNPINNQDKSIYYFALLVLAFKPKEDKKYLALVIDYQLTGKKELLEEILLITKEIKKEIKDLVKKEKITNRFNSADQAIDYLANYFKEDLISELVEVTGLSDKTIKKYQRGITPNQETLNLLILLAQVFYSLEVNDQKSRKEILDWYQNQDSVDFYTGELVPLRKHLIYYNAFSEFTVSDLKKVGIIISDF